MTCLMGIVAFVLIGLGAIGMAVGFVGVAGAHGSNPSAVLGGFGILFLGVLCIAVLALVNVVLSVVYAMKANQGEWAPYPIVGPWALRLVGAA